MVNYSDQTMAGKKSNSFYESIKTIIYALLIALFVRTLAFEPFNIPSGSMMPTLKVGDYLFVSKFSYGYSKHSLPLSLPVIPGRILFSEPERGDVVVFKLPSDNRTDYIKRIIGLPGDKIQMRNGRLHINGKVVSRKRTEIKGGECSDKKQQSQQCSISRYIETLPNGKQHAIFEITDQEALDNTGVFSVPKGHYFAMGDNRDNSQDSRVRPAVGFIPKVNLVGKANILFFSVNDSARWWEIWKWPSAIRARRLFKVII